MSGFLDALAMGESSRHKRRDSSRARSSKRHRSRSRSRARSSHRDSHRDSNGFASFLGIDQPSSSSKKRSSSGIFSLADDSGHYKKHGKSTSSFFGLGGEDGYKKHSKSTGSFFSLGNMSRGSFFGSIEKMHSDSRAGKPSYYKRSPRKGFLARAYSKLKRLLRDLVHYAKRHPWKVFFLAVMPLVTTGALGALLARFGLRVPHGLEAMLGMASKAASGDSFGLARDAMRMAGDSFGGGASGVRVERGRDPAAGVEWERREGFSGGGGGGGGGWGDSIMGVAKMFM